MSTSLELHLHAWCNDCKAARTSSQLDDPRCHRCGSPLGFNADNRGTVHPPHAQREWPDPREC